MLTVSTSSDVRRRTALHTACPRHADQSTSARGTSPGASTMEEVNQRQDQLLSMFVGCAAKGGWPRELIEGRRPPRAGLACGDDDPLPSRRSPVRRCRRARPRRRCSRCEAPSRARSAGSSPRTGQLEAEAKEAGGEEHLRGLGVRVDHEEPVGGHGVHAAAGLAARRAEEGEILAAEGLDGLELARGRGGIGPDRRGQGLAAAVLGDLDAALVDRGEAMEDALGRLVEEAGGTRAGGVREVARRRPAPGLLQDRQRGRERARQRRARAARGAPQPRGHSPT